MLFSLIALPIAVFCSSTIPVGLVRPAQKSSAVQALTSKWLYAINHYDPASRIEAEKHIKEAGLVLFYSDAWTLDQLEELVNALNARIQDSTYKFADEYDPLVILAVLEGTLRKKVGSAQHSQVKKVRDLVKASLEAHFETFANREIFRDVMIGPGGCESYANLMINFLGEDGVFFMHLALGGGKPVSRQSPPARAPT